MISLEAVSVEFKKQKVLDDFSLSVSAGEKILITGPSGAGKSTLFKTVVGFTEQFSGKILVANLVLNGENVSKIRKKIFFLCQDFNLGEGLLKEIIDTVFEFEANRKLLFDKNEFLYWANYFEFSQNLLEKPYKLLSNGERQRFLIILCNMLNREIWLFDEPTSALDEGLKEKVVDFVLSQNKTIVVISHDSIWLSQNMKHIQLGVKT